MNSLQKPGEKPNGPGEYLEVGPMGGKVKNPRQVTIEPKDSPLPPTSKSGNKWQRINQPPKSK